MAAISYDGQSFIIDSRRVWLVSGGVHYARTPRGLWAERIRAASRAGLNCVETPVIWELHEPDPGVFRFTGQHDLKHFVEMVAAAGMRCILRIGPYVGDGWAMGGLPAWLLRPREEALKPGQEPPAPMRLRQGSPPFLQAVARYFDHVVEQVRDLQVTSAKGGPIVAVQSEQLWLCDHPKQAEAYFGQVNRFLREAGCTVPVMTRNNLWQQVNGTMETWHGSDHAFCTTRQMHVVQPEAPPLVHVQPSPGDQAWGEPPPTGLSPNELLRRLVEVSAAGGMFNIDPFCGGTTFGFHAGRLTGSPDAFLTPSHVPDAPVGENGTLRESYTAVKRIATFLSHFADLMSHLRPTDPHTVATSGTSVIHQAGSQGSVVFITRDEAGGEPVELATPDGRTLTVHMGDDTAAWVVLNANLGGVATLDITNLRPWAFIGRKLLVLFGPAGTEALIGVGRTLLHTEVPTGTTPTVLPQDNLTLVILNGEQVDAARITDRGLEMGGLSIGLDGKVSRGKLEPAHRPTKPKLGPWQRAGMEDYAQGTAARFATIEGPKGLEECGADRGYGWYSVVVKSGRERKVSLMVPQSADRLHLYVKGNLRHVLGAGPGAKPLGEPVTLNLPAGESTLVFLADNLGRFAEGLTLDSPAGVFGHLLGVKPLNLRKPHVTEEQRVDPFEVTGYLPECSEDAHGPHKRFTWELNLPASPSLIVSLRGPRPRSVLLINNHAIAIDPAKGVDFNRVLKRELHKGRNRMTLALIEQTTGGKPFDPAKALTVHQVVEAVSQDAQWHYARWQVPEAEQFTPVKRSAVGTPAFFRTTFQVKSTAAPLTLELSGGTKGQIYLNGHNLGRYFLTTPSGKKIPTQSAYYLPEPWLKSGGDNELVFFDEHGAAPMRSKLSYA